MWVLKHSYPEKRREPLTIVSNSEVLWLRPHCLHDVLIKSSSFLLKKKKAPAFSLWSIQGHGQTAATFPAATADLLVLPSRIRLTTALWYRVSYLSIYLVKYLVFLGQNELHLLVCRHESSATAFRTPGRHWKSWTTAAQIRTRYVLKLSRHKWWQMSENWQKANWADDSHMKEHKDHLA